MVKPGTEFTSLIRVTNLGQLKA